MNTVTVHLNGKAIEARPDETILQVVRRVGLGDEVPTLCYDPRLPPNGACFLCVVEVEGVGRLLPACATPVNDGMKVALSNDRVRKARQTCLTLLLSNHDADCEGPCRDGCPAGIDIQSYLQLVAQERYEEAYRLIRERNPLVTICGRVCVRRCEDVCRRKLLEGPVGINHLKRLAADRVYAQGPVAEETPADNGHKVAIIGAGPAGLTCAYYLRKQGTAVAIYEALPAAGGMLRWGIPEYRLPNSLLDQEVRSITDMGVEIHYNVRVGEDLTLDDLRAQGHEAIFLGPGAQLSNKMRVKGEDGPGVMHGVDVLRDIGLGTAPDFEGKRIVVVGGGNTAIDVARTAARLKAAEVRIVYRRTRAEMPANEEEVEAALEENVAIDFLKAPTRCLHEGDRLVGLECVQMKLGEPDASGRRRPVPVEGSEHVITCDIAVAAIGQAADLRGLADAEGLPDVNRWGTFEVDELTGATSVPGVFAAGDAVTGPQAVIDAVGSGRRAAYAIQRYLEIGEATLPARPFTSERFGEVTRESLGIDAEPADRLSTPMIPIDERKGWVEVEETFTPQMAVAEAKRCLECGCNAFEDCDLRRYATEYGADPTPYAGESPRRKVDQRHPWITIDPNKCILCSRCVRTCGDVLGVSALGLIGRGFDTIVAPAMNKPLPETGCISCGSCVEACPTGALTFTGSASGRLRPTASADSVCGFCGVGCHIEAQLHGDAITIRSRHGNAGTFSDLCVRGRFGHRVLGGADRIDTPMVRKDGELVPVSLDEALDAAVSGVRAALQRFGKDSSFVAVSPKLPCEDALAATLFAKEALGTDKVASLELTTHRPGPDPLGDVLGSTRSSIDTDELASADVILLVGADPTELRPVAALAIRRAIQRGAKLVVLASANTPLVDSASVWLRARRGTATIVLAALGREVTERGGWPELKGVESLRESFGMVTPEYLERTAGIDPAQVAGAAELLLTPGAKVAMVADLDDPLERAEDHLVALGDLLLLVEHATGAEPGLLLLAAHANAFGLAQVGVRCDDKLTTALDRGDLRVGWVFGEDPLGAGHIAPQFKQLGFLVAADHVMTETLRKADVVFPLASHLESGGTYVSASCVAQSLSPLAGAQHPTAAALLAEAARRMSRSVPSNRADLTRLLGAEFGIVAGERFPAGGNAKALVAPHLSPTPAPAAPTTLLAQERRVQELIRDTLGR